MNSFVVGIDLGERESFATYMSPDGEIKEHFTMTCRVRSLTAHRTL